MYKSTKAPSRATVPTPRTATIELCQATEAKLVAHYQPMFSPSLLIAHRSGCYATVINSTISGIKLDQLVGTDNAKLMTENVLGAITASFSTIE